MLNRTIFALTTAAALTGAGALLAQNAPTTQPARATTQPAHAGPSHVSSDRPANPQPQVILDPQDQPLQRNPLLREQPAVERQAQYQQDPNAGQARPRGNFGESSAVTEVSPDGRPMSDTQGGERVIRRGTASDANEPPVRIYRAGEQNVDPDERAVGAQRNVDAGDAGLSMQDLQFIVAAGASGMFEVRSSQTVQGRTDNADVRAFADQMINDHRRANRELRDLANRHGVALPQNLTAEHQQIVDRLSRQEEPELSRAYLAAQVRSHREAVGLFERQLQAGFNPELRDWTGRTLPTLRNHLTQAERLTGQAPAGNADQNRPRNNPAVIEVQNQR